jgi:hypothetical protein
MDVSDVVDVVLLDRLRIIANCNGRWIGLVGDRSVSTVRLSLSYVNWE